MVKHFSLFQFLGVIQPAGYELDLLPFLACGGAKFGLSSSFGVGKGNLGCTSTH